MKAIVALPKQKVLQTGQSMSVNIPTEFLTDFGLKPDDQLFSIVTLNGEIRYQLSPSEWSKKAKIRGGRGTGSGVITLAKPYCDRLGLRPGTELNVAIDRIHGILILSRA